MESLDEICDKENKVHKHNLIILFHKLKLVKTIWEGESQKEDSITNFTNMEFMCKNITTLLYPQDIIRIDQDFVKNFFKGLICPNNMQNDFGSEDYNSDKQLYLLWTMQRAKQMFDDLGDGPGEEESGKILIMELEA